jgi:hypothetical protein
MPALSGLIVDSSADLQRERRRRHRSLGRVDPTIA